MNEKLAILGGTPARKEFLPIGRPFIGQEEKDEVMDTLGSDWLSKGQKTKKFEQRGKLLENNFHAVHI